MSESKFESEFKSGFQSSVLSENESEWSFLLFNNVSESKMVVSRIQDGRIQDGCHHQDESECMSEVFFVQIGWIQVGRFQDDCHLQVDSEWISEVGFFVQNSWIQDGRIQDGFHHQVESEWMTLSQIEFVLSQNGWIQDDRIQDGRIQDGCHYQDESECMSEVVFLFKMAESNMAEFKMADIIKIEWERMSLNQIELVWVRVFLCQNELR